MSTNINGTRYLCDEDLTPLLVNEDVHVAIHYPYTEVKLYKRRWVILIAFSLLGFIQSALWNTWGPISSSAKIVFPEWTDATIALLSNWGNICYVLFLLPVIWIMDKKGLRSSTVMASSLIFLGSGIRCFSMDSPLETWFIHTGHIINGVAGIVMFAGPPQLSAAWFPPQQRTTATGIIYVISSLGVAAGSLFPPIIVDELPSADPRERQILKEQVLRLMYLQFFFASIIFLWVLIYFPAKPPFPPSLSAAIDRLNFISGLKRLTSNKDVWLIGISFGVSTAIYSCWVTVIHINLEVLGIDQREAGWIGCYSVLGGCLGTLLSSRLYDLQTQRVRPRLRFLLRKTHGFYCLLSFETMLMKLIDVIGGRMKLLLTVGLVGSALSFMWFLAIFVEVLPLSRVSLYSSLILGGMFNYGLQPVFMEMGAEVAYPIGEAIVGGFLTGIFNVIGTIFLFIFFIPDVGYLWMNWCLILSSIIAIPLMLFVNERYVRSNVDIRQQDVQQPS